MCRITNFIDYKGYIYTLGLIFQNLLMKFPVNWKKEKKTIGLAV